MSLNLMGVHSQYSSSQHDLTSCCAQATCSIFVSLRWCQHLTSGTAGSWHRVISSIILWHKRSSGLVIHLKLLAKGTCIEGGAAHLGQVVAAAHGQVLTARIVTASQDHVAVGDADASAIRADLGLSQDAAIR